MKQEQFLGYGVARTLKAIAALSAVGLLSLEATGQTLYWTGAKMNNMWTTAPGHDNWSLTDPFSNPSQSFTGGANVVFSQSAITAGEGLVDVNGPISAGTISLTNTSGSYNFTGTVLNGVSLTANGGGNLTLGNSNTNLSGAFNAWGGSEVTVTGTLNAAAISASGFYIPGSDGLQGNTDFSGTIILGNNNLIGDAAPITLGGGTLRTNGYDEGTSTTAGLGALTLAGSSILDFTNTGGLLHFAGFMPGTSILEVWNWDSTDQLYFSPQLDQAKLSQIVFYSDNGLTQIGFGGIGTTGIVPVPEPATILGGIALLGFITWRERRRIGATLQMLR